jgi:aminoglycoside phosphotransferase (APT) family kinase protein
LIATPSAEDNRPSPRHGWLAAVVPADATTFRVQDPELAATLKFAGARIVDASPDVEIGPPEELRGDAACAVVEIRTPEHRTEPRLIRGGRRIVRSSAVRARVVRARRALAKRGYQAGHGLLWERGAAFGHADAAAPHRLAHRFPLNVVVVGHRPSQASTQLDAALAAVERATGRSIRPTRVLLSASGVIIAVADDAVLRVALGMPAQRIDEQRIALDRLRTAGVGDVVADRVPWVLAHGRAGLAVWSLERRLQGSVAPLRLSDELLTQSLEFLVALHGIVDGEGPSPSEDVKLVAVRCDGRRQELLELAERAEDALTGLPRGLAHGDFWSGNLLIDGDAIVGVVDWPSSCPGQPPLVDLLHLKTSALRELSGADFGAILVEHILPTARAGGDELDQRYCRQAGIELGPPELEALVIAYWLRALRHYLLDPDREPSHVEHPAWRRANIDDVVDALVDFRGREARTGSPAAASS